MPMRLAPEAIKYGQIHTVGLKQPVVSARGPVQKLFFQSHLPMVAPPEEIPDTNLLRNIKIGDLITGWPFGRFRAVSYSRKGVLGLNRESGNYVKAAIHPVQSGYSVGTAYKIDNLSGDFSPEERRPLLQLNPCALFVSTYGLNRINRIVGTNVNIFGVRDSMGLTHIFDIPGSAEVSCLYGLEDFFPVIQNGDVVALDNIDGWLHLNPPLEVFENVLRLARNYQALKIKIQTEECREPSQTRDGKKFPVQAVLNRKVEAAVARNLGLDGVGNFRTEIPLILGEEMPPGKMPYPTHLTRAYNSLDFFRGPMPVVTLRTADLNAEKWPDSFLTRPACLHDLPYGGLPLSLSSLAGRDEPLVRRAFGANYDRFHREAAALEPLFELFENQIDCFFNIAYYRFYSPEHYRAQGFPPDFRILFPMVENGAQIQLARREIARVRQDSRITPEESWEEYTNVRFGAMIENIPAVANLFEIAAQVDFLVVGGRDLLKVYQDYWRIPAASQTEPNLADPAYLKLIKHIANFGKAPNPQVSRNEPLTVGICGAVAEDLLLVPLLMDLGVDNFVVTPHLGPLVKHLIRSLRFEKLQGQLNPILDRVSNPDDLRSELIRFYRAWQRKGCFPEEQFFSALLK